VARKRVLLDECNTDLGHVFGPKDHVFTARDFGIAGKPSKRLTREQQLRIAVRALEWDDTREHNDLVRVSAEGKTRLERLCHPECAAEFPTDQTEWD
jgi:hypothetical protein